jgi:hypothetical protein
MEPHTETTPAPTAAPVLYPPPPQAPRYRTYVRQLPAGGGDSRPEDPAALMLAALEQLEAQRAAMQWLLEADLLRLCLV